jgi:hypothetical protein
MACEVGSSAVACDAVSVWRTKVRAARDSVLHHCLLHCIVQPAPSTASTRTCARLRSDDVRDAWLARHNPQQHSDDDDDDDDDDDARVRSASRAPTEDVCVLLAPHAFGKSTAAVQLMALSTHARAGDALLAPGGAANTADEEAGEADEHACMHAWLERLRDEARTSCYADGACCARSRARAHFRVAPLPLC